MDLVAVAAALIAGWIVYRHRFPDEYRHPAVTGHTNYFLALSFGSLLGATLLGTLNLYLSDVPGLGRSILGAILGAIAGVELYKARHGMRQSTGAALVIPLAVGIALGRIGCFLVGLDDYTYGIETGLPWAWDFGDGVPRHPVQLYEAISVSLGGFAFLVLLRKRPVLAVHAGFYFFVAWYAAQRFVLEFLKPYAAVIGSLNVFHLGCLLLMLYALLMLPGRIRARA